MADGAQQAGSPNRGPRYAGAVLGRPGGLQDGCRRCGVVWTALQVQQARSVSGPCTLACRPRTLSRPTPPGEGCSAPVPCPLPCFGLAPRHPPCTVSDRGPRPARRLAAYCSGDHGSSAFVAALGPRRRALDPTPPHCPRNRGKPTGRRTSPRRPGPPVPPLPTGPPTRPPSCVEPPPKPPHPPPSSSSNRGAFFVRPLQAGRR